MRDRWGVELRVVMAEGVVSGSEAEALAAEAQRKQRSPLALLVERGRLSEDSRQSLLVLAQHNPGWRNGLDPSGRTHTMAMPPPPATDEPGFPVASWDRYVNVRFLGQGGMGKVFLAVDTRLRREVAIKFVRGDDADHVRRLISEARAQAKVSHERICKVYEVGEVDGKLYIAMQYIDGQPLGSLSDELTLEQKVMLIRGAAEGLHEAHRAGIIHRDIKPSNIMIERTDDGDIRPYVMDFGLARTAHEVGATQSGVVLGTPRYMAPEQAHGDTARLDRRADIYSLGATLYHVLTGEPPVPGETVAEVIHNLASFEPRPPRALAPDIPIDLEAIVLKCLEKQRSARYDSARALADDLGRFMNGEPVRARSCGVWYRMRKRIAKHRRLVIASAAAAALCMAAVGWGIAMRAEANERERLARRFTEMVERIEAIARYSALSPRHDIRGDRQAIRARMDELDGEIHQAGAAASGPGHYALGRGYLALDDDDHARAELEVAWQAGFREPRVAYAMAVVMGHLYQHALLAAERIEEAEPREARKREIERQYRDPARIYLAASQGAEVPSTEYFAALTAYYDGRLDDALAHLDAIGGGLPWFYEALQLRGDILLAKALALRYQGAADRARVDFEAGRNAYAAAAAIGESVPAAYQSLGELEYAAMLLELYGKGEVMPPLERALEATARVLAMVPDDYHALVLRARIRRSLAEHQLSRGVNVEDLLANALTDAGRAMEALPRRREAQLEMARIWRQWGDARLLRNQDPGEQLRNAVAISEAIPPRERDATYYGNLGLVFSVWADYQDRTRADSRTNRKNAIDAFTSALKIDSRLSDVWTNLGIDWFKQASQPRAKDPDHDLTEAIVAFDRAKALNPTVLVPYLYGGEIHELIAQHLRARGLDPGADLVRALKAYQDGLAINRKFPHLHNGIGMVYQDQATEAWDRGADPAPLLMHARAAFEEAIAVAPEQGFAYNNTGEVFLQEARFQIARGEDPNASAAAAIRALNLAIPRLPEYATPLANLAAAHAILGAYALEQGRDPRPEVHRASVALDAALHKNLNDAQSQLILGETRGILAKYQAREGRGKANDFETAADAFQKAIELAPSNDDYPIAFGRLCRAWAVFQRDTGSDPGEALTRGLALANSVLARRPAYADALVVRGSLLLLGAQSAAGARQRRAQAVGAARDLTRALAINPALGKTCSRQAALAQQLASGP